jgi:hypothetical protein
MLAVGFALRPAPEVGRRLAAGEGEEDPAARSSAGTPAGAGTPAAVGSPAAVDSPVGAGSPAAAGTQETGWSWAERWTGRKRPAERRAPAKAARAARSAAVSRGGGPKPAGGHLAALGTAPALIAKRQEPTMQPLRRWSAPDACGRGASRLGVPRARLSPGRRYRASWAVSPFRES